MSNRIVQMPPVESFDRLVPDKWLLLKTLEEAAEMVEAGKRLVKGDAKARQLGLPLEEVRAIIREGDGRPKPPRKVEFIEPPLFEQ